MKLRAIETAKVATITSGTKSMMAVLDCLKDRAAPSDEYTVLAQHNGGKSYWLANMLHTSMPDIQDEMLSILAEKGLNEIWKNRKTKRMLSYREICVILSIWENHRARRLYPSYFSEGSK
jgi:hypothetical protein